MFEPETTVWDEAYVKRRDTHYFQKWVAKWDDIPDDDGIYKKQPFLDLFNQMNDEHYKTKVNI